MGSLRTIRRDGNNDIRFRRLVMTVNESQRDILAVLIKCMGGDKWHFGGWSEREIAEGMEISIGKVRKDLGNLVKLGLVDRRQLPRVRYRAAEKVFDPNVDHDFYLKHFRLSNLALDGDYEPLRAWATSDSTIEDLLKRAMKKE